MPSHGRIPRTGNVFGDAPGIFGPCCNYGPLARSVPDLYLGLSIMGGPDLLDPYAVPAQIPPKSWPNSSPRHGKSNSA
jgi:amidase